MKYKYIVGIREFFPRSDYGLIRRSGADDVLPVSFRFEFRAISVSISCLIRALLKNTRGQHAILFSVGDAPPDVISGRAWKIVESVSSLARLLEGLPSEERLAQKSRDEKRDGSEIDTRPDESLAILAISKLMRFAQSFTLVLLL